MAPRCGVHRGRAGLAQVQDSAQTGKASTQLYARPRHAHRVQACGLANRTTATRQPRLALRGEHLDAHRAVGGTQHPGHRQLAVADAPDLNDAPCGVQPQAVGQRLLAAERGGDCAVA